MENVNFTAPAGSSSRLEVPMIPTGMHLCTLHGIADLGTQDGGNFGPKHKVNLAFEFPSQMRTFYEGDPQKPSCVFVFESFSMAPKANLRTRFVQPMISRQLSDTEADNFNFTSLLGKSFIATITHSSDGKWANISSLVPLDASNMQFAGLTSPEVAGINPKYFFHSSHGYESENFKALPKFIRDKIKSSHEGVAHANAGGKFLEPAAGEYSNAPSVGQIELLPNATHTLEQYRAQNWTDDMLISQGLARMAGPVAPPTTPSAPVAPAAAPVAPVAPPVAAAPVAPPVSAPPAAPVAAPPVAAPLNVFLMPDGRKCVMNDPNANIQAWILEKWTPEALVSSGHASFQ